MTQNTKSPNLKALTLLFILFSSLLNAQTINIAIDENFEDWKDINTQTEYGIDINQGIDLINLKVTNDENSLFVYCKLSEEINLVNNILPQDLRLHIDTDNNPNTGSKIQEQYGIDLTIDFLAREAYYINSTKTETIYFGDIGFLSAPTVSTLEFEVSINLGTRVNGQALFTIDSIRILMEEKTFGDRMPDVGKVFKYALQNQKQELFTPIDLDKTNEGLIRVCSYNVLFNSGWDSNNKIQNLKSICQAIDGDVFGFQESRGTNALEAEDYLNNWLPLPSGNWHASNSGDLITCSKWPIIKTWTFNRHLAVLINLPETYNTDILVINTHLSCCSSNEARQEQVDNFCAFIRDAKTNGDEIDMPENTPIIYLGDFNLVGFKQQIETIINGDIQNTAIYGEPFLPDWDSTSLADAKPTHSENKLVYTWRSLSTNKIYPPGRLDFQFYTDSKLDLDKSYVLNTAEMSKERLTKYNINALDSKATSDHLPVVADYNITDKATSSFDNKFELGEIRIYPNPAKNLLHIQAKQQLESITIRNIEGSLIYNAHSSASTINIEHLSPGVYFIQLKVLDKIHVKKLVIKRD